MVPYLERRSATLLRVHCLMQRVPLISVARICCYMLKALQTQSYSPLVLLFYRQHLPLKWVSLDVIHSHWILRMKRLWSTMFAIVLRFLETITIRLKTHGISNVIRWCRSRCV